jgi:hypothetical protein
MERQFELMLVGGKRAMWSGRDGVDAARRYVDCHVGASVTAWRTPRVVLQVGVDTSGGW